MMKKIYCVKCGHANNFGDKFCVKCGTPLQYSNMSQSSGPAPQNGENIFQTATRTINSWTGEDKSININLGNFFSEIWKSHTEDEAENIFIAGTKQTTPSLLEVSSRPVQPWLYSRIFVGLLLIVGMLYLLVQFIPSLNILFMTFLSISVPFSLLIFFYEINVFKNISFYTTMKIFLIGGLLSLLVTMILYMIVGTNNKLDLVGAMTVGLIEETGKLIVGAYFVSRLRLTHVFNGMLVGGAVGAGFAAIENIEYASLNNSAFLVPIIRSFGSLGTHAIWCAISVAALVLVNGNRKLTFGNIANIGFLRFFLCSVILHGLWDWDISLGIWKLVLLICAGWLILFVLIHTGLREVKFIQNQLQETQQTN